MALGRIVTLLLLCSPLVLSSPKYVKGSAVALYSNKIGPYNNPSETYSFSHFTDILCQPPAAFKKSQDLGEMLNGDTKASYSVLQFPFAAPVCTLHLVREDVIRLKQLIENRYYYEFTYDDIPLHGFVGYSKKDPDTEETEYYYYTHSKYTFYANMEEGDVIFGNITFDAENAFLLSPKNDPMIIPVTYSAQWYRVPLTYKDRYSVYSSGILSNTKTPLEKHWFSILNSMVLVIILAAVVAFILYKVLKKDLQKYNDRENPDFGEGDYGWKEIRNDVFRLPQQVNLLSAFTGVGVQFIVVGALVLLANVLDLVSLGGDGQLIVSVAVIYVVTSFVSGFVSAYWYKKLDGEQWVRNVVLTCSVFSIPFIVIFIAANSVSVSHGTTHALPIEALAYLLAAWILLSLPLTLIGAIAGKRFSSPFNPPVQPKRTKRQLPELPYYRRLPSTMLAAGFIPFSAIFTELHYIFSSLWGHAAYHLWSILLIVFVLLLLVTALTCICLVYLQISTEDWAWWWSSFLWGGSTGVWMLAYSLFYYYVRSDMSGTVQTTFYFGYQFALCYVFFLSLGSLGFLSSVTFMRKIYKNLHMD